MRYELTKELETGNALIDSEHRQLFEMVNRLQEACSMGKGRGQQQNSAEFLLNYVQKHFGDEEQLQTSTKYPGYVAHRKFHQDYIAKMQAATQNLLNRNADIASLAQLNQLVGVLVSHIRVEDKKMAAHVQSVTV